MCNIEYEYHVGDSFADALHKVITALRQRGLRIYNFQPNTYSGETDLKFLQYAAAHRHSNATSKGYIVGCPIFTGRADTITHISHSLEREGDLISLPPQSSVTMTPLNKVIIKRPVSWADKLKVLSTFRTLISGAPDGERTTDVIVPLEKLLDDLLVDQLKKYLLVYVSIGSEDIYTM
jgi:hypothetical protein